MNYISYSVWCHYVPRQSTPMKNFQSYQACFGFGSLYSLASFTVLQITSDMLATYLFRNITRFFKMLLFHQRTSVLAVSRTIQVRRIFLFLCIQFELIKTNWRVLWLFSGCFWLKIANLIFYCVVISAKDPQMFVCEIFFIVVYILLFSLEKQVKSNTADQLLVW